MDMTLHLWNSKPDLSDQMTMPSVYWNEEQRTPFPIVAPPAVFLDARKALADHLRPRYKHMPQWMKDSQGPGGPDDADVVYGINDRLITSQAEAVDALKATAKDLRNQP